LRVSPISFEIGGDEDIGVFLKCLHRLLANPETRQDVPIGKGLHEVLESLPDRISGVDRILSFIGRDRAG
jgi:hypothetical protein